MPTTTEVRAKADKKTFMVLAFVGRWFGFGLLAKKIMPLMFAPTFMNDPARAVERNRWLDHIASIEEPEAVNSALAAFLSKL